MRVSTTPDTEVVERPRLLAPIHRPKTTAEEVESRLVMAIVNGDKKSGERVTELELASAFQVSRVPVREAMRKLEERGILERDERRGLRIPDYSPQRINDLVEIRVAIEKVVLQRIMAPGRDKKSLLDELERIVERMSELVNSSDSLTLSLVDLEFHRAIVRHSGMELAIQIWEGLAQRLAIVFCQHWSKVDDGLGEAALHQEMIDFLRSGSADDIEAVLINHFTPPPHPSPVRSEIDSRN